MLHLIAISSSIGKFRAHEDEKMDGRSGSPTGFDRVYIGAISVVLRALYSLPDDQAEFQILDRRSFGRFLGFDDRNKVPDAKTIWLYRERLPRAAALARLFDRFEAVLDNRRYLAIDGQMVDATIVEARRPRLTVDEKATIKGGGTLGHWSKAKGAQMDRDGRWTLKRGQ